jgi:glycosyltransferase involved in cell wall biosynthesis
MEGLGLLILEAIASGLPVITTDHPPMNEYGGGTGLLVSTTRGQKKAFPSQWINHAYLKLPLRSSLVDAMRWCTENDLTAIARENRAWAEQIFNRDRLAEEWRNRLGRALRGLRDAPTLPPQKVIACIPSFNCASQLGSAIQSARLQGSSQTPVVVIDDASTDNSAALTIASGARLIQLPENSGRGAVRRHAIEQCSAEFVLFLDAGIRLSHDFLERALAWMRDDQVAAVCGSLAQCGNPKSGVERWRARHLFKTETAQSPNLNASLMTGAALLRRDAILAVGNFNPRLRLAEDRELGERLLKAGYKVVHDPALKIFTRMHNTTGEVLERYCRWNLDGPLPLADYAKHISYSWREMASSDLRKGDKFSALLSISYPHYALLRSWFGR